MQHFEFQKNFTFNKYDKKSIRKSIIKTKYPLRKFIINQIGFSPYNGQVVFFENPIQKISTFPPLHSDIRLVFSFCQAEHTKNGVKLLDLDKQLYQPNHQSYRFKEYIYFIFSYVKTLGASPKTPSQHSHPKTRNFKYYFC